MKQTRMTHQRRMILQKIEELPSHVSAELVYDQLKVTMPELSLSTVYRNLKALADEGKVSVSDLGSGLVYEKVQPVPHHHLVCLSCKRVVQLDHARVQPFFAQIEQTGFQVATNHLCIYGYCEDCQKTSLQDRNDDQV